MPRSRLQNKLNEVIFGTETPAGKTFDVFLIAAIIISVVAVIADSINALHPRYDNLLLTLEWFFTIIFTIEYITRLYCAPHPWHYARSFYGIIDLLAILPSYVALAITGAHYALVIRLLRILRVFRILKLLRYSAEANVLARSILQARRKIQVFLFFVLIIVTIFGSLMFVVEGPENGFSSIPQGIYWAIITITTVGYGDIVPQTIIGKALASIVMVTGYSIIAVPTGIITAELANELRLERSDKKCRNCGRAGHEVESVHCKYCGEFL